MEPETEMGAGRLAVFAGCLATNPLSVRVNTLVTRGGRKKQYDGMLREASMAAVTADCMTILLVITRRRGSPLRLAAVEAEITPTVRKAVEEGIKKEMAKAKERVKAKAKAKAEMVKQRTNCKIR